METQKIKIFSSLELEQSIKSNIAFLIMGDWFRPITNEEDLIKVYNSLVTDPSVSLETDSGVVSRLQALEDLPPTPSLGGEASDVNII